jgi:hypothetical protein
MKRNFDFYISKLSKNCTLSELYFKNEFQDSESSNSDKSISYSDENRKFGEIDFSSGRNVDQFDMSKTPKIDRNNAGSKDPEANRLPVSSINFEFDVSKERSPKMIDGNSEKSTNFEIQKENEDKKNTSNSNQAPIEEINAEIKTENFSEKIDTSLFDISDDNFDGDVMTWRPLRLTPNGVLRSDVSEVISTSNENGETIVTVLSSDSWIPNGGPIMKERD